MFKGSIPALISPFNNGSIDLNSFEKIIEWSLENGSHGFVPCGTTGESPTLTHDEHKKIIEECIRVVNKRAPVIAGTGSNNTIEAKVISKGVLKSNKGINLPNTILKLSSVDYLFYMYLLSFYI